MKKEHIDFLKELQHEMLTQDNVSQADPRFWVVRGTVREFGYEEGYADGCCIVADCETTIDSMKEACDWLNEIDDSVDYGYYDGEIRFLPNGSEETEYLECLSEVCEHVRNNIEDAVDGGYPYINYYKELEKNFSDTLFLTNRECKEHIKRNHYHYPKNAHSYAMTAWRSPQVEMLYKIIQETNWEASE